MLIEPAPFEPDKSDFNGMSSRLINNVLPAATSYRPLPLLRAFTNAVPGVITGAFLAKSLSGQIFIFAGTQNALWLYDGATRDWTDVSKTGSTYASSRDEPWTFAQFGDRVVAVHANTVPQSYMMGGGGGFADLAGSPPNARLVAVWGDFLVLANLLNAESTVQWSGLNNPEDWTFSDYSGGGQFFPDGGAIKGVTSGTNPLIFQEYAIRSGLFVPGSIEVFSFSKVSEQRGLKAGPALAQRGNIVFSLSEDGFYQYDLAGNELPIGQEKVNRYFIDRCPPDRIADTLGVVDPIHSRVYWAYSTGGLDGYDSLLIYDWMLGKWSQADIELRFVVSAAPPGYTLEQIDSLGYTLDELPFSLDDRQFAGGSPALAGFNKSNCLSFFTGESAEATLLTQENGATDGTVTRVWDPMPVLDSNGALVSIGSRFRRSDDIAWGDEAPQSPNTGICRKRARARYHTFKVRIPADTPWTHFQGVDVQSASAGLR